MIKRQIPNLITLGNLGCGVVATYAALWLHDPSLAALFICGGILLDFFDGLSARLLGVSSPLGKELDSLADVVTSGVAPAAILYCLTQITLFHHQLEWLAIVYLLIPLCAAYRLAKFNLDTRQTHSFLGLPVPSQALVWVGLALSTRRELVTEPLAGVIVILAVSVLLNGLMLSSLPLFSLKFDFKKMAWNTNKLQYIFLITCALIIILIRDWMAIPVIILWYILLSVITRHRHNA